MRPTRRSPTSPTARTRTSAPPTTRRSARACTCSRWSASSAARSCRSTTCSTSTRRACCVGEFEVPACAIIKHNNPCGAAVGGSALEAYRRAFACDPLSAFGGVICFNRPVDGELADGAARAVRRGHLRAAASPTTRVEVLSTKPNLRILEDNERRRVNIAERDVKRVMGGLLVQDRDMDLEDRSEMEVVTERKPTEARVGRDAVRLEGVQARALQRDRARARPRLRRASAPGR